MFVALKWSVTAAVLSREMDSSHIVTLLLLNCLCAGGAEQYTALKQKLQIQDALNFFTAAECFIHQTITVLPFFC